MTNSLRKILAGASLAATAALVSALSVPATTAAFATVGGSLSLGQRAFRVFNNFSDASANNNKVPQPNFPGQTGAVLAIWKGHVEWASEPHAGTGAGDGSSTNPVLGNGGANFDNIFQGTTTTAGGNSSNIHSELPGGDGSTLAFTILPISDGWTIKYYSDWTWADGPGAVTSGVDLQGVACHEIGHSLGLDHSTVSGSTMFASISGNGVSKRSIEPDDIAGVQSIYGVKSADKPHISALSGSPQVGKVLTIAGTGFSATGGEVWFTRLNSDGDPLKVTNVSSSDGGTLIDVTIPAGAHDGEVLVKTSGSGNASLSNAFPIGPATVGTVEIPAGTYSGPLSGKAQVCSEGNDASFKGGSMLVVEPQVGATFDAMATSTATKSGQSCELDVQFTGAVDASGNLAGTFQHSFACSDGSTSAGNGTFTGLFTPGKVKLTLGGVDTDDTGEVCTLQGKLTLKGPPGPFECDSKRLSLAAKALKDALTCHVKSLKPLADPSGDILAACVQASLDALAAQADVAAAKAAVKGGTCTAQDMPAVVQAVATGVQALVDAVTTGLDAADPADLKLRGQLLALAAKDGSKALAAQSKNAKKPDIVKLQAALAKARQQLLSKATKLLEAAAADGLPYAGPDAEQLADQVDALVEQLVELLS